MRLTIISKHSLMPNVHGWRPGHSVNTAVRAITMCDGDRLSFDIEKYFCSIDQTRLARRLNRLDPTLWPVIEPFLPPTGIPTGFRFSTTLGNLYLSDIDRRFPIIRYADNIMVIAADPLRVFRKIERHLNDIGLRCHKVVVDPTSFCKQLLLPAHFEEVRAPVWPLPTL